MPLRELENVSACFYCGGIGNTIDHVPPVSTRKMLKCSALEGLKTYPFYEVPCCSECNGGLNDKLCTLKERKAYIGTWLAKRYRRILEMPDWSENELKELSPSMEGMVRANLVKRELVRSRIKWAHGSRRLFIVERPCPSTPFRILSVKQKPTASPPSWTPTGFLERAHRRYKLPATRPTILDAIASLLELASDGDAE